MIREIARFHDWGKKIVCIGRNYASHAKELGNEVPKNPFFFLKPTTSYLLPNTTPIILPFRGIDVHHEIELGIVIGKRAKNITRETALDYVAGYTIALDLTARCVQQKAKEKGLPWSEAKGFDTFCPVSGFIPKDLIADPQNVELKLTIDGEVKQHGNTSDMIFSIPHLLEYCSSKMTLEEGDLLLTGTPHGVGPIQEGQILEISIPGIALARFPVAYPPSSNL